jgi:hypothetical protein
VADENFRNGEFQDGPVYRPVRRGQGMDPGTRRLALIAAGIGGTLLLVVGGYELGGSRHTGVPVIQADSSPLRVKPANPGGLQVAGAGEDVFSGGSDHETMAPPPEAPAPQALRAELKRDEKPATPTAPAQASALPAPPAPPTAAPAGPAANVAVAGPARQVAAATPAAATGSTQVQLAAMDSEAAAKAEWDRLTRRMPDLLGKRQPAVERADHDGHTIWRLRTGGFTDIASATSFCERVRSKGAGCSIASF